MQQVFFGEWTHKRVVDNKAIDLADSDDKFESNFENSKNSGTAIMVVLTGTLLRYDPGQNQHFGCSVDQQEEGECKQNKMYSLYMLDGPYSDQFDMLMIKGPVKLEASNELANASDATNQTYHIVTQLIDIGRQVELYRFKEWNVDSTQTCSFNIDIKAI